MKVIQLEEKKMLKIFEFFAAEFGRFRVLDFNKNRYLFYLSKDQSKFLLSLDTASKVRVLSENPEIKNFYL